MISDRGDELLIPYRGHVVHHPSVRTGSPRIDACTAGSVRKVSKVQFTYVHFLDAEFGITHRIHVEREPRRNLRPELAMQRGITPLEIPVREVAQAPRFQSPAVLDNRTGLKRG